MFQFATRNTLITPPIEVNCIGSEQTIEGCQVVRPLQCSTDIAGVNCTGMYTKLCACVGMNWYVLYMCVCMHTCFFYFLY